LCASIAICRNFGVAGNVRSDFSHADFDQARSAALQLGQIVTDVENEASLKPLLLLILT